jgi:hypothetical protein
MQDVVLLHAALAGGAEELCPIVAVRRTRVSWDSEARWAYPSQA